MITNNRYRLPAEWEPQSAVQLTWPHALTDWEPMLEEVTETYRQIAREIEQCEPLLIIAPEDTDVGRPYFACPTDDTWARDHGFLTLTDDEGHIRLLDYQFNGWGRKFPANQDNAINRRLYDAGLLNGEYTDCLDFVLEGGSIESDGCGTILTTTGCLMAKNRNQPLTKAEIEARLKHDLCADRVLWIDHGQLTGDDTDGHIDTLVRICPCDTILYVGCDDPDDEQYQELKLMEEQLHTFRTAEGRPYRLLKLPMPSPIYEKDADDTPQAQRERLPATYANFLVVNDAVLCPTYAQPDLDAKALHTISQAFPDRDIIGIDCCSLIRQHGSLHCCTMQFPIGTINAK